MAAPTVPTFMALAAAAPVEILEEEDLVPLLVELAVLLAVALVDSATAVPLATVPLETPWAETATAARERATTDWNCMVKRMWECGMGT